MKTFFKILAILLVILALAVVILPYVFKDKITSLAKQEINKQVVAQVDFTELNFSLIRSFPNFRLSIENLSVVGKNEFQGDTLAFIPGTHLIFNIIDIFRGNYIISKISLIEPRISIWTKSDGKANYDIMMPDSIGTVPQEVPDGSNNFSIHLKKFSIVDGQFTYLDDESKIYMTMKEINHTLHGDLGASRTTIFTQTSCADLMLQYEESTYLNHVSLRYESSLDADLDNGIYTFGKNELTINKLKLNFEGSVSMMKEGINLVLTYNAPSTAFKELLSLVPATYLKDYEGLETTGMFSLNGDIKGIYTDESYPSFTLNLAVQNGTVKYPDLPGKITNIGIKSSVTSPGGVLDHVMIDVQNMHLEMGNNPLDMKIKLSTPISDPEIDFTLKAQMDLATVKDYYPINNTDLLKGTIVADIALKGKLSAIENEQYEQFLAMGSLVLQNMEYSSPSFKNPVVILLATGFFLSFC